MKEGYLRPINASSVLTIVWPESVNGEPAMAIGDTLRLRS